MSMLKERRKPTAPESDMTPMMDVTFSLLIFFMVTASFAMQRAMAVPKSNSAGPRPGTVSNPLEADVFVEVDEFNTFHVATENWQEEAPSEHDLVRALRRLQEESTNMNRMLVKANGEALHDKVVAALDSGAYVGISEIRLLTIE